MEDKRCYLKQAEEQPSTEVCSKGLITFEVIFVARKWLSRCLVDNKIDGLKNLNIFDGFFKKVGSVVQAWVVRRENFISDYPYLETLPRRHIMMQPRNSKYLVTFEHNSSYKIDI